MCENLSVRSGSFYSHLDDKDLFIACNVQGEKIEMSVSTSFDRGDVDIHSVENCCEKNAAVISLNVYEHGVIASVKETALLKAGTAMPLSFAVGMKFSDGSWHRPASISTVSNSVCRVCCGR